MNEAFAELKDIAGYIALVAGAVLILKSKIKTDNIKDLKDRVDILEKERAEGREQHLENQKAIANLEGQLKTYKEIPLKSIADSLKALPQLVMSNGQILDALQNSATLAAQDKSSTKTRIVSTTTSN